MNHERNLPLANTRPIVPSLNAADADPQASKCGYCKEPGHEFDDWPSCACEKSCGHMGVPLVLY